MQGQSNFDPFPIEGPYCQSFGPNERLEYATNKINEAITMIREWQTIMNIMGYKGWTEPLTGDIHVVLKFQKIIAANHIGEAAELEGE